MTNKISSDTVEWKNIPTQEDIDNYVGFVYIIRNKFRNKFYVGQKLFHTKIRRKPLKGTKRVRLDKVESKWRTYWGSSKQLLDDIKSDGAYNFEKQILYLCSSKSVLNYIELFLQLHLRALEVDNSYNRIVNVRIGASTIANYDEEISYIIDDIRTKDFPIEL